MYYRRLFMEKKSIYLCYRIKVVSRFTHGQLRTKFSAVMATDVAPLAFICITRYAHKFPCKIFMWKYGTHCKVSVDM